MTDAWCLDPDRTTRREAPMTKFQAGDVVTFIRCGEPVTAVVIGPDTPPLGSRGVRSEFSDPRYLARSTVNRMVCAFTLSEVIS
jgi:hypothetical protein